MPIQTPAIRPARVFAEAHKKKQKEAREKRAASRVAVATACARALARARVPRADRLRDALTGGFQPTALTGDLQPYRRAFGGLRNLPDGDVAPVAACLCDVEARATGLALLPMSEWRELGWALVRLMGLRDQFVRPLSTWTPPRRRLSRAWHHLVAHLLHRYPVPAALDVTLTDPGCPMVLRGAIAALGAGQPWRSLNLPTFVTRAVAHALSTPVGVFDSAMAMVRDAQARALGLSPVHRRIVRDHDAFDAFNNNEDSVAGFFQFLARHPDIAADDLGVMCRAWETLDDETKLPTMKGRTPRSLLGVCRELLEHQRLRTAGTLDVGPLPPAPFAGGAYVLVNDPTFDAPTFEVSHIDTGRALVEEGIAMRHCVGTYATLARNRTVAIYGVRRCVRGVDKRALTIEVQIASRTIAQVRGRANRLPSPEERAIVRCWAVERGLTIRANVL